MAKSPDDIKTAAELIEEKRGLESDKSVLIEHFENYFQIVSKVNPGEASNMLVDIHTASMKKINERLKALESIIDAKKKCNETKVEPLYRMVRFHPHFDQLMKTTDATINAAKQAFNGLVQSKKEKPLQEAAQKKVEGLKKKREDIKSIAKALCAQCIEHGGPTKMPAPPEKLYGYPVGETFESEFPAQATAYNVLQDLKLHPDFWDATKPYDEKRDYTDLDTVNSATLLMSLQVPTVPDVNLAGVHQEEPQPQPVPPIQFTSRVEKRDDNKVKEERVAILMDKIEKHADFIEFQALLHAPVDINNTKDLSDFTLEKFCGRIISQYGPVFASRSFGKTRKHEMESILFGIIDKLKLDKSFWDLKSDWKDPDQLRPKAS